jgi:hypothetical protein
VKVFIDILRRDYTNDPEAIELIKELKESNKEIEKRPL